MNFLIFFVLFFLNFKSSFASLFVPEPQESWENAQPVSVPLFKATHQKSGRIFYILGTAHMWPPEKIREWNTIKKTVCTNCRVLYVEDAGPFPLEQGPGCKVIHPRAKEKIQVVVKALQLSTEPESLSWVSQFEALNLYHCVKGMDYDLITTFRQNHGEKSVVSLDTPHTVEERTLSLQDDFRQSECKETMEEWMKAVLAQAPCQGSADDWCTMREEFQSISSKLSAGEAQVYEKDDEDRTRERTAEWIQKTFKPLVSTPSTDLWYAAIAVGALHVEDLLKWLEAQGSTIEITQNP